MANYALLTVLRGKCNNMGLKEITFKYPLQTDHDRELHKLAIEKITQRVFQLRFYWSLVEPSEHTRFLEACASITGAREGLIIEPHDSMHGEIHFAEHLRLDGYTLTEKDQLVQRLMETGIVPALDNLEFTYRHHTRLLEQYTGEFDPLRLEKEQRAAFAKYLTFHAE